MERPRFFQTTVYHVLLRAALLFLTCAALFPARTTRADDAVPAIGVCSDEVLRAETRLCDLGFLTRVSDGVWREEDADALARFAEAKGVSLKEAATQLFDDFSFRMPNTRVVTQRGSHLSWAETAQMLSAGKSYTVTSCYTSVMLHMVCVSVGEHAVFRPEIAWDEATLAGFFDVYGSMETAPVTISVDGLRVAASVRALPASDETGMRLFSLFCYDSSAGIGGMNDGAHQQTVEIAAAG